MAKVTTKAKLTKVRTFKNVDLLDSLSQVNLKSDLPEFRPGDKLQVKTVIKEGDKERVQVYEGVCTARAGRGIREMFTVRKISYGVGVERTFPLHSPRISGIEVMSEGFVRRSKLYYLRELSGKSARIKDKRLKLAASMGSSTDKA